VPYLVLIGSLVVFGWLLRRDCALRTGVSHAIWIPTLWAAMLCSRPLSAWLGVGSGVETLEGSPVDRAFYLVMIVMALLVLARRQVAWSRIIAENWAVFFFYGFLLCSVLWANSPTVSFKRWFKEIGNLAIVLVILTEMNPLEAVRAVFVRCGIVLIPLSLVFVRYFPHLGRTYGVHSGEMEVTGVTFQKNALGTMLLVCGLIIVWDWLERTRPGAKRLSRVERWVPALTLTIGLYLLMLSDSKTSIVCLLLGALIIASMRLPLLRRRINAMGLYFLGFGVAFFLLDWTFGISAAVVANLGRDMTFTGRTDVWRELLNVGTDPIFGTGFMSFWDDAHYQSKLPEWVAFSAHNGYLEVYLAGGFLGVAALALMLLRTAMRVNAALATGTSYAVARFAILCVALLANFSESNFACMTPLGLLFLVAAIGHAGAQTAVAYAPAAGFPRYRWAQVGVAQPSPR
jgi:exopolysaccharide production protein ExoQ